MTDTTTQPRQKPKINWTEIKDEELLKVRICDFGLEIEEGTEIKARIDALYAELEAKGFTYFRPRVYFGDEWFSPEGVPSIAVPFYLANARLRQLEKKMMLEVEGGTEEWCMKILRHEAGHCFDHAYRVSRKRKWRALFGSPKSEYDPDYYQPRPYSKNYVINLDDWYAQSHPDEDFAETFAVWLNPAIDWKKEYSKWPGALKKIEYVNSLVSELKEKKPLVVEGPHPSSAARMRTTLGRFYQRRIREIAEDKPDFYDSDLKKIFSGENHLSKRDHGASRFLKRNRKELVQTINRWNGAKKYTINSLVKRLALRCDEIDLRLGCGEAETMKDLTAYLATLVTHYQFTGRFKRTV